MIANLPKPIADYLDSEKAKNFDHPGEYFAPDALVFDENNEYRGLEAIRAWKLSVNEQFQYVVEPLSATESGSEVVVHARMTGNFPGSPAEADFKFTLADDLITSLEIL